MRFLNTKAKNFLVTFNLIGITLIPLVSLIIFAYIGTFTRYISDDYYAAASLQEYGYWGAQAYWWKIWTGRYSFIALILFVDILGLRVYPILAGLSLLFWILSLSWAAYQLLSQVSFPRKMLVSVSLGSMITWMSLRSLVQYPEVVFWKTGICNYAISPILFSFFFGLLRYRLRKASSIRTWEMIAAMLLSFISGGLSETGVAVQIILLGGGFYFLVFKEKQSQKNALLLLSSALLGSILSLVVMSLSPGNLARAGDLDNVFQIPDLVSRFYSSFSQALSFIPKWFIERTTLAGLAMLFGMILYLVYSTAHRTITVRQTLQTFFEFSIFAFLGVWAALAPSYLARGYAPPERAILIPYFLITCLVILWGWLTASLLNMFFRKAHTIVLQVILIGLVYIALVFGPIATISANLDLIPVLRTYSNLWDERHQFIKDAVKQGETSVVVTNLQKHKDLSDLDKSSLWIVGELEEDPDYWINQGAAWYYGLEELSTK